MHAAAVFLLAIQCLNEDYFRADTRIERKTDFALISVGKPSDRHLERHRIGDVTIHTRGVLEDGEERGPIRLLRVYAEKGGNWWQLRERGAEPVLEDVWGVNRHEGAEPIVVERIRDGLIAVRSTGRWVGANTVGTTARTFLLDFTSGKPRVRLMIDCTNAGGGGACTAPSSHRQPHSQLTCDARLRCTSTETQWIDWTTRTATRTFDLLTGESIPPERFGAKTYASGKAYAEAFAADRSVLAQRVVIDRAGPVTPVFELSRDSILFAGPAKEGRISVRFFHLTPGNWREIAVTRLSDENYPGQDEKLDAPRALDAAHTPDAPQLLFFASNVEFEGTGRLVEVVAREGEARSLYWIMFDPNGRTSAIRLATDTPEFRHCDEYFFPPSVTSVAIPDAGLPASIAVIPSWRMTELEKNALPKRCGLVGRLGWSPTQGWQPVLFEAPCAKPWAQPYATTLEDDGTIGWQIVKPRS